MVSFHSLEDRLVKQFLRNRSDLKKGGSRYFPEQKAGHDFTQTFQMPFRKALQPAEVERQRNPRSRSARLRAGIRTMVPISLGKKGKNHE